MGDVSAVDMSLDDIIRLQKRQKRSAGFRGRGALGSGRRGASRGRGGGSTRGAAVSSSSPGLKKRGAWRRRGSFSNRATATTPSRGAGRSALRGARAITSGRGRAIGKTSASVRSRGSNALRRSLASRVAATAKLRLLQRQPGTVAAASVARGPTFGVGRVGDARRRLQQRRRLQSLRTASASRARRPVTPASSVAATGTAAVLSGVRAAAGSSRVVANRLSARDGLYTDRAARAAEVRQHQREQRFQTQAAARQLQQALAGLKQPGSEELRVDYPSSSSRSGSLYSDCMPAAPRLLGRATRGLATTQQDRRQFASGSSYLGTGPQRALTSRDFERSSARSYVENRPSLSVTVPGATRAEGVSWRSLSQSALRQPPAGSARPAAAQARSGAIAAVGSGSANNRRRELELLGRIKELESELAAARQKEQQQAVDAYNVQNASADDDEEDVMEAEPESEQADDDDPPATSLANSRTRGLIDSSRKPKAAVQQRPSGKSSNRHVVS